MTNVAAEDVRAKSVPESPEAEAVPPQVTTISDTPEASQPSIAASFLSRYETLALWVGCFIWLVWAVARAASLLGLDEGIALKVREELQLFFAPVFFVAGVVVVAIAVRQRLLFSLEALKRGKCNLDLLEIFALISAVISSALVVREHWGLYSAVALTIDGVACSFGVGLWLAIQRLMERRFSARSDTIEDRMRFAAKVGEQEELVPGQSLTLSAGSICPALAEVIDGCAETHVADVPGPAVPGMRYPGLELQAGERVSRGSLEVKILERCRPIPYRGLAKHSYNLFRSPDDSVFGIKLSEIETLTSYCCYATLFLAACLAIYFNQHEPQTSRVFAVFAAVLLVMRFPRVFEFLVRLSLACRAKLFELGVHLRSTADLTRVLGADDVVYVDVAGFSSDEGQVIAEEILDERIDRQKLLAIGYALSSASSELGYLALRNHFSRLGAQTLPLVQIENPQIYPGLGVTGEVKQSEFTLGNEDFLVSRGVRLQPSEVLDSVENSEIRANTEKVETIYLAAFDEPLARFRIKTRVKKLLDAPTVHGLRGVGARVRLLSKSPLEVADRTGQALGLEKAEIQRVEKIEELTPLLAEAKKSLLLIQHRGRAEEFSLAADSASIGVLDKDLWNLERYSMSLCSPIWNEQTLRVLLSRLRNFDATSSRLMLFSILGFGVLVVPVAAGLLSPNFAALAALGMELLAQQVARPWFTQPT